MNGERGVDIAKCLGERLAALVLERLAKLGAARK